MKLKEIIQNIKVENITGNPETVITGIQFDSRKIESGNLFVATRGTASDGHTFIPAAIENGAAAIICEDIPETTDNSITYIQVKDSADALGHAASAWYGFPSSKLILTGITGTNGKTTTTQESEE